MRAYRIILADDHVIFRQGMKRLIEEATGLEVVGEANNGTELLKKVKELKPDMVLLDISMPNSSGIDVAHEIQKQRSGVKVLILTMHKNKEYLYHAMSAGAHGYLLKEDSDIELFSAIEKIRKGGFYVTRILTEEVAGDLSNIFEEDGKIGINLLTRREKEILKLIAEGKFNKEIADILGISIRTVENHRANIIRKTKLNKPAELVRYAIEHGLLEIKF
ncbi:response regulator [Thermodesulfobacteriota bacterium]